MFGGSYVVAALVFVLAVAGAGIQGWHLRGKQADAEIAAIRSDLAAKVSAAEAKAAKVESRVVIQYRDKIIQVEKIGPEVAHEIQIVRDSGCVLPPEWVRLHDAGAGSDVQAPAGADAAAEGASCADAIETVRANYLAARENAEQLRALQAWAAGISSP